MSLNPGDSSEIPIQFTLPETVANDYGICHTDYTLHNSENNIIQFQNESPGGRFALYRINETYTPLQGLDMYLTVGDENAFVGENVAFTLHVKNHSDSDKTIEFQFDINHGPKKQLFTLTIPAGGEVSRTKDFPVDENRTFRLWVHADTGQKTSKGIFRIRTARTKSSLTLQTQSPVAPGKPLNYTINTRHYQENPVPGNYIVKLVLEKFKDMAYEEIAELAQFTHDYGSQRELAKTGTYLPAQPHTMGQYRLRLTVMDPYGQREHYRYQTFYYSGSDFKVIMEPVHKEGVPVAKLLPATTYTVPLTFKNETAGYDIREGRCTLTLTRDGGEEIFRKEITGIAVKSGAEFLQNETFTFNPLTLGSYTLKCSYGDELRENNTNRRHHFNYETTVKLIPDKPLYHYQDTANLEYTVTGTGTYSIRFTCAEAGIDEARNITIPVGSIGTTRVFQVPIGLEGVYKTNLEVKDDANINVKTARSLPAAPLMFDYRGSFTETSARAGTPLHLDINIKGGPGMTVPVPGELTVRCPALNYENTTPVTMLPGVDNQTPQTIPINGNTPTGNYEIDVTLKINGIIYINKHHHIELPGAAVKFHPPAQNYNAGETIPLPVENTGGKSGNYDITVQLRDNLSKEVYSATVNHTIPPGATTTVNAAVPASVKNGRYLLLQEARETGAGTLFKSLNPVTVTGTAAGLESITQKEKFFENETVTGSSEIRTGPAPLDGAQLEARILALKKETGGTGGAVQLIMPKETYNHCMAKDSQNRLWVGTVSGISRYDGSGWEHYATLPGGTAIGPVSDIAVGPGDTVYAVAEAGIVKWEGTAAIIIPHPEYMEYSGKSTLAVDTLSRIWCI
ncbi:MAG: hypothetical protein GY757_42805, partial [bacterium]|nr:hypothetical protein [bacterium]